MTTSLFSVYSQGENRVTATLLAVLERLSLPHMDRIMQALLGCKQFKLVEFVNQPRARKSTPDAKIITSHTIWIETKTSERSVDPDQIKRHLESVGNSEKLLLLTPDENRPTSLDDRVIWSNFRQLVDTVRSILSDKDEPPSEGASFLLRELVRMVEESGLTTAIESRVLVRAATRAWPIYKELSVYFHGRHSSFRPFRPSGYFAFYLGNEIKEKVPKIKSKTKFITLDDESEIQSLEAGQRELVRELKQRWDSKKDKICQEIREEFKNHCAYPTQWMFLSGPDDEETVKLCKAVINDQNKEGRRTAFTQNRRYVSLESLKNAKRTSDLGPA